MKPEQRLLLALTLTLGILLLWSLLVPSPPTKERVPTPAQLETQLAAPQGPLEPLEEFALGPFSVGVGAPSGGIYQLKLNGSKLLSESKFGLLGIDLASPSGQEFQFKNEIRGGSLLSTAEAKPSGLVISRTISAEDGEHNYFINIELRIQNSSNETLNCQPKIIAYLPLHALNPEEIRYLEGLASVEGKAHRVRVSRGKLMEFQGQIDWISSQGKSFALIIEPNTSGVFHVEHPQDGTTIGQLTLSAAAVAPRETAKWNLRLYAGPIRPDLLEKAGLQDAVYFGLFSGVAKFLLGLLNGIERVVHNYGWAILFLSVGIWLLFFPVTWSGVRMMKVMGEIQPQVQRIQKEYAKDRQRMNQELIQLYRKHRVNPLGGCLPLIFQMPIVIALFQVLSRSPQLQGAEFLWIRDLSRPDALVRFPSSVPVLGKSLNLLPILMVAAMFVQQQMSQQSQKALTEEQAMQQKFFKWFPILFGFLFYGLPSGLVLYWVINTTLTIGQQLLVKRVFSK